MASFQTTETPHFFVENQSRVVDPLRRFSRNKKTAHQHQERDEFYSDENVNPMEAAQFFDDDSEQF